MGSLHDRLPSPTIDDIEVRYFAGLKEPPFATSEDVTDAQREGLLMPVQPSDHIELALPVHDGEPQVGNYQSLTTTANQRMLDIAEEWARIVDSPQMLTITAPTQLKHAKTTCHR